MIQSHKTGFLNLSIVDNGPDKFLLTILGTAGRLAEFLASTH